MLEWSIKNGCTLNIQSYEHAFIHNNLNLVIWLYEHNCPWNEHTFNIACYKGYIDIVKWLYEHGCPLNIYSCSNNINFIYELNRDLFIYLHP